MAKFKEPGFMTRQVQRNEARFGQAIAPHPTTSMCRPNIPGPLPKPKLGRIPSWLVAEVAKMPVMPRLTEMQMMAVNPCRELNLADPIFQNRELARHKPKGIQAVNKWEDFDTHKPRHFNSAFRTPENYMAKLKKHGFRCIGSGAYSAVFAKGDSKRVIKVCRRADTDAYPMFAEWAHKHPSPYLPVIHSFQRHERKGGEGFYVVVLDRYKRTVDSTSHRDGWQDATRIIWDYARAEDEKPTALRTCIRQGVWTALPGMKEMIDAFKDEFEGIAHFDMHDGNWMVTETGQLVMIDPLSGATSDAATKRNKRVSRIKASVRLAA